MTDTAQNTPAPQQKQLTTLSLFSQKSVAERFEKLLGEKSQHFITSVLQIVKDNRMLADAEPHTVLNAAATAASLDLVINNSIGQAWIVPYKNHKAGKTEAQFQMGWKGFVQLALRTNQYHKITAAPVYENQFKSYNVMSEQLNADFTIEGEGQIKGYACYFRLLNGFEKLVFWTTEQVERHGARYSRSYNSKTSAWKTNFEEMALKTLVKNTLSKWGVLSIDMKTAIEADQSIQTVSGSYVYPDNDAQTLDEANQEKENNRILEFIEKAENQDDLDSIEPFITEENREAFDAKVQEIKDAKK